MEFGILGVGDHTARRPVTSRPSMSGSRASPGSPSMSRTSRWTCSGLVSITISRSSPAQTASCSPISRRRPPASSCRPRQHSSVPAIRFALPRSQ